MHHHSENSPGSTRKHLRVQDVAELASRSISTIWDITNPDSPKFDPRAPKRICITPRCTRFSADACGAWLDAMEADGQS
jgi:predicted DNA-binding transcriptional regulator AlpA